MLDGDFYYNGKRLSDLGYVFGYTDDYTQVLSVERELIKDDFSQYKNKLSIQGTKYTDSLTLEMCIIPRDGTNESLTTTQIRELLKWLTSSKQPQKLIPTLSTDDNTVRYYKGLFTNCEPLGEKAIKGIKATFTCSVPYPLQENTQTFTSKGIIYNDTDELSEYIHPIIILSSDSKINGNVVITNENDIGSQMALNLSKEYDSIKIDCENHIVYGDDVPLTLDEIGWSSNEQTDWFGIGTGIFEIKWLRLVPEINTVTITDGLTAVFTYETPIKVGGF